MEMLNPGFRVEIFLTFDGNRAEAMRQKTVSPINLNSRLTFIVASPVFLTFCAQVTFSIDFSYFQATRLIIYFIFNTEASLLDET